MILVAIAVVFETWVWRSLVDATNWLVGFVPWRRIRPAIKGFINRAPAILAVLLFGVPVLVMESGSAVAVLMIAFGHVWLGTVLYGALKLVGVSLIAVIYDLTREKLMSLSWFVWLNGKFEAFHAWAHGLLAPYRAAALNQLRKLSRRALAAWGTSGFDLSACRERWKSAKAQALSPRSEFD